MAAEITLGSPEDFGLPGRRTEDPRVGDLLWWVDLADRAVPQREPVQVAVQAVEKTPRGTVLTVLSPDGLPVREVWNMGGTYHLRKREPKRCEGCGRWGGHLPRCEKRRNNL